MHLSFMGATDTVTGSKYLLTTATKKILVDCGLFQGYKELLLRNWNKLPFDPRSIDAVILTHAHIDHSGYIPLLIKNGFSGKIYCSHATRDLCAILLPDSGHLQEEEARLANRLGYSKHKPALPLYTREDAENSLAYFSPLEFATKHFLDHDFSFTLHRASHILGASFIQVKQGETTILFSGDLGRPNDPIMCPPVAPLDSDYVVIESTYGNRIHDAEDPLVQLEDIVNKTVQRNGVVVIPSFAVGRAQTMLYYLHQLKSQKKIPNIPIYLDSPMAIDATKLFYQYSNEHRLSKNEAAEVCATATYIHTLEESQAIDNLETPMIIISASGMATGGRVLQHMQHFAPNARNTILFVGYQAGATRGDRLVRGEKEIKIHGEIIPVQAQVMQMHNLSAHADAPEILNWLSKLTRPPQKVFITHGEPEAATALKKQIEETFGWTCVVPTYLEREDLG